jgi:hypothetical protein
MPTTIIISGRLKPLVSPSRPTFEKVFTPAWNRNHPAIPRPYGVPTVQLLYLQALKEGVQIGSQSTADAQIV